MQRTGPFTEAGKKKLKRITLCFCPLSFSVPSVVEAFLALLWKRPLSDGWLAAALCVLYKL
jgi:hypothetical protein